MLLTIPSSVTGADREARLLDFMNGSDFCERGGIITDLDGTAVHEDDGRIVIPQAVELGLKHIYELGRPLVINSLRFPLSVIRTFGTEWYSISNAPIPCVTLNGSLLGYVQQTREGGLVFEEISAIPLSPAEIDTALDKVKRLVDAHIKDILIFYYPRDWRAGEVIWTPVPEKVTEVKEKYTSASSVTAVALAKLREQMHVEDICMIFLLVNIPEDQRMAYQHTRQANFITHADTDKLRGAEAMAAHLQFSLADSIGAGDTEMDRFLQGVGLAIIVGQMELKFNGLKDTLRLKTSSELGDLLFRLATLMAEKK